VKRALYHPARALPFLGRLGFQPVEVELLRYEEVETARGPTRWAVVLMPTSPDSVLGILCRREGRPLPPPQEKKVPAESVEEID
jgi:hypothetical protein